MAGFGNRKRNITEPAKVLLCAGSFMDEAKAILPLKIGLLITTASYFLFTFHAMFTLSWIGEWDRIGGGSFGFVLLVEDISATIGLVFRFLASIIALALIIVYLAKKNFARLTIYKLLRIVLVFEGIYWLGLIATAGFSVLSVRSYMDRSTLLLLNSVLLGAIPTIIEAIVLPIALFSLAFKLSPNKPLKGAIKWALIVGTIYIVVFWLINTSIWVGVVMQQGTEYLTVYPEHLLSFLLTTIGLLALTLYAVYFTKKSSKWEVLQGLKLRPIGFIVSALGLYFFWNYLSWVIFAGAKWNDWYAWFLGHNMDLWMLSLPLAGLPLILKDSIFYLRKENNVLHG